MYTRTVPTCVRTYVCTFALGTQLLQYVTTQCTVEQSCQWPYSHTKNKYCTIMCDCGGRGSGRRHSTTRSTNSKTCWLHQWQGWLVGDFTAHGQPFMTKATPSCTYMLHRCGVLGQGRGDYATYVHSMPEVKGLIVASFWDNQNWASCPQTLSHLCGLFSMECAVLK